MALEAHSRASDPAATATAAAATATGRRNGRSAALSLPRLQQRLQSQVQSLLPPEVRVRPAAAFSVSLLPVPHATPVQRARPRAPHPHGQGRLLHRRRPAAAVRHRLKRVIVVL